MIKDRIPYLFFGFYFILSGPLLGRSLNYDPEDLGLKVRVRIFKDLKSFHIKGTDLKRNFYIKNKERDFPGRKRLSFHCEKFFQKNSKKLKKFIRPLKLASISSQTGLLSLFENKYSGRINVLFSPEKGYCDLINETSLEHYINSLLTKEMNGSWPVEALKAQAVAARSYAFYRMNNSQNRKNEKAYFDLENSEKDQVTGHFFDSTKNTVKATQRTHGLILTTKKGKMTPVFYHARCGGKIYRPYQVWSNKVEGYQRVPCPYCYQKGRGDWEGPLGKSRIPRFLRWVMKNKNKASFEVGPADRIKFLTHDYRDDFVKVEANGRVIEIRKPLFRRYFGRGVFPSNNFVVNSKKYNLNIQGSGLGHGVGMCQIGALEMAKRGKSYKEILGHYFPLHKLERIY